MAATQNDSESRVEGAIAIARNGRRETDHRLGYGIHAIAAGIYRRGDHHDLRCRGSGAVWAKVNGCRVADVRVSESEVGIRRDEIWRYGHDGAAPCVLPFRPSLQLSPPCAPFCAVFARPSPLLSLLHLDPRAYSPLLREGWVSHLCPCLVCLTMIPSLMVQNHCVCE